MGFLEKVGDVAFKTTNGTTLFFPWGVLGAGYIVNTNDALNQIRLFYRKLYTTIFIAVPILVVIQLILSFYFGLFGLYFYGVTFILFTLQTYANIKKITQSLPVSSERLTLSESFLNSSKPHSMGTFIFLEIISFIFILIGIISARKGQMILGTLLAVIFIFFALCIGYWIIKKNPQVQNF